MLNRSYIIVAGSLLILASLLTGAIASPKEDQISVCSSSASVTITGNVVPSRPPITPVTNPAATYCVNQGYRHEIRTHPVTGAQTGYCIFPDNSECEVWSFFRGSCTLALPPRPSSPPHDPASPPASSDGPDPQQPRSLPLDRMREEIAPLLEKEAAGTLTPEEATSLGAKRLQLLDAQIDLLQADAAALAARRALLKIEEERLTLEEERLALAQEAKGIERRSLLGVPGEEDASRLAEIENLILVLDLKLEALEIEERSLQGSPRPGDSSRLLELSLAISYLEEETGLGV